jgi:Holliday junction DNA helicase RuvA
MLASFSPDQLRQAIATEDINALTRVPGIGRKGAQRIVLELAGRLGSPGSAASAGAAGPAGPGPRAAPWRDQVRAGLVNLGWPSRDAELAIAAVEADLDAAAPDRAELDGAELDGAELDEAALDGAAAGGARVTGQAAAEVDVAQALRAALRKLSRA